MIMKSFLTIFAALLVACLYIGFYEKMEDAYPEKIFFFKKAPTFQVRFENIFAYESDDKNLSELSDTERQQVICRSEFIRDRAMYPKKIYRSQRRLADESAPTQ
nr:hypothetical protein [Pseudomonas cichorii]